MLAIRFAALSGHRLLFGLAPAVRVLGGISTTGLKDGGRSASGGVGIRTTRGILVLSEVALAFVLLVGAALIAPKLRCGCCRVDPGFYRDGC